MSDPAILPGVNSYLSLEEANDIAAGYLFATAFTAATEPAQARALITATALLDRRRWKGRPLSPTQPLQWPRLPDSWPIAIGAEADAPAPIKRAAVELACHLLQHGEPADAPIQSQMLGDSMLMYFPRQSDDLPKAVRHLIAPYLVAGSAHVAEVRF